MALSLSMTVLESVAGQFAPGEPYVLRFERGTDDGGR
jgi:hypothetical protein